MDLSESNYVEVLAAGADLQLLHPGTGLPFSASGGRDLHVKVLGIDAEPVEVVKREFQRSLMSVDKETARDSDRVSRYEIDLACAAAVEFRGGQGKVKTLDEFRDFLRTHKDGRFYARQIIRFSENTARFFEKPSKA